jgi:hypothetical protein
MPAVKIVFKRSSVLGKRPTGANLEPGEIGLNTNGNDPGLFFEVNDGSVVKAGPTAYLPEAPTQIPALGELWVDSDTKALSIGNGKEQWQKVGAPFLGGTNGLTVFVAPDFPNSTDSLSNDGQTVPFLTINRAILEVTKSILQDTLSGISTGNNRYLIMLAPGRHCVVNRPGVSEQAFDLDLSNPFEEVTQETLRKFNPEGSGGLILPRGVSIIGLDLKKCTVHPTYVPKYTHPEFPPKYRQQLDGPIYENEPRSSIFRWTGNTYVSNFTCLDKIEERLVTSVSSQENTGYALFRSSFAHGLAYNQFTNISYSDTADQTNVTFKAGAYYVKPVNSHEFLVSPQSWDSEIVNPVEASSLPPTFLSAYDTANSEFIVSDIYPYYVPGDGTSYELSAYSHHRLSCLGNASLQELNNYYVKVQKAFPNAFAGKVIKNIVSDPETQIVAPAINDYPNNLTSNSTDNSSPYENMVNHRSDYGMSNGDYDGNLVTGFKSVIVNSSTAVILQKDPVAYELYSTSSQDWFQLTRLTQETLGGTTSITSVPLQTQLENLNEAAITDIRYYYDTLKVADLDTGDLKSTGIADVDKDFRHFGFRLSGPNSYMQAQSTYTIGAAIGCWAKDGAIISLTNATTNFGSVALESEGFSGIGTLGGANTISKGFLQSGIFRPLRLVQEEVESDRNKRIMYLGSKVVHIDQDPLDPSVQNIYLQKSFDPAGILPFSLLPGSALFVTDGICTYRGFFVTDGSPTCILSGDITQNPYSTGGGVLRLRKSDSTIPRTGSGSVAESLDIPFIRRFIDPRNDTQKSYGFYIQSTNPTNQAPQRGSVLRLNQTGQNLSTSIKRNYQFDPGRFGGIAQTFTVDLVQTEQYSLSPNFNYKIADSTQSTNYVAYASLTDASSPWVQSVPSNPADLTSPYTPVFNPQGSYVTYSNKNYYSAENNSWQSLYYQTTFNELNGPIKVSPDKSDSPFVISSVITKSERVVDSWQGYVKDPYYTYYTEGLPESFKENLSYMRGAVVPYAEYPLDFSYDGDDGSIDLGITFKRIASDDNTTVLVSDSIVAQSGIASSSPFDSNPTFGRPEVLKLDLLTVQQLISPLEDVSILQLSDPGVNAVEYVRVISLNSNIVNVIRNVYPEYSQGTLPEIWPSGTVVKVCGTSADPEPSVYDPDWSVTKSTVFRFFELMGYSRELIAPFLKPVFTGERILLNESIPLSPINGYANKTVAWPVEFNTPSTIVANTHTWQYAGFLDYSRGLPKYQSNQISRKLANDFLSTPTWGGRLTVTGANEEGQIVLQGPLKEALTGRFYETETPIGKATSKQTYRTPETVEVPKPVLVFSADDISDQFDGVTTVFDLSRGGYAIPASQLSTKGTFVFLGGIVQKVGDAYIVQEGTEGLVNSRISFSEAPLEGTSCDIRIVSSDDQEQTVEIVNLSFDKPFDGVSTSFTLLPSLPQINNLNSFVFLSGVEQNPTGINQTSGAYTINDSGEFKSLSFIGEAPLEGTPVDTRVIITGSRYRNANVSTVFVNSVDDISPRFNSSLRTFALKVDNVALDPVKVNAENIFVSLGGVMQVPVSQKGSPLAELAYTVTYSNVSRNLEITFAVPPLIGTTCNIRVITSDEYITCPIPDGLEDTLLRDGPNVNVNAENQIIGIDPGEI